MPRNGFMRIIKKIHKNADYNNRIYYFNSLVFFLPYYSYLILSGEYLMNGVVPNILRLCLRFKKITVKKSLFFLPFYYCIFSWSCHVLWLKCQCFHNCRVRQDYLGDKNDYAIAISTVRNL